MILSGKEILRHLGKEIIIEPFDPSRINPNSHSRTGEKSSNAQDSSIAHAASANSKAYPCPYCFKRLSITTARSANTRIRKRSVIMKTSP